MRGVSADGRGPIGGCIETTPGRVEPLGKGLVWHRRDTAACGQAATREPVGNGTGYGESGANGSKPVATADYPAHAWVFQPPMRTRGATRETLNPRRNASAHPSRGVVRCLENRER
jgi:hypothetical protein